MADSAAILFVPDPLPDELVSSWIARVAEANGVSGSQFFSQCHVGRGWRNRDWDRPQAGWLADIGEVTEKSLEELQGMTLHSFALNLLDERDLKSSRAPWILPHAESRGHSHGRIQFCPECLGEDPWPYFRRCWRWALMTTCPKHPSWLLMDCCPGCGQGVLPLQPSQGLLRQGCTVPVGVCGSCGFCLPEGASHPSRQRPKNLRPSPLRNFLLRLEEGYHAGWFALGPKTLVMMVPFLKGLHQIIRLISTAPNTRPFRDAVLAGVRNATGCDWSFSATAPTFERMRVYERHALVEMVSWLVEQWPERFIEMGLSSGLTFKAIVQDLDPPPCWLWEPASIHLRTLFTPWRDPLRPKREQYSYGALASRIKSPRLAAREQRLDFIAGRPGKSGDLTALATEMKAAGLYSPKSDPSCIRKHLPKLVLATASRREWWRIAGKPQATGTIR